MFDLAKKLFPYLIPYRGRVLVAVLLSFALAAIKGAQAYLVKPIFDQGLNSGSSWQDVIVLALTLLALGVINFPCRFFHFYWLRMVVDGATCTIRTEIYNKLQRLSLPFYTANKQGVLLSTVLNDTQIFAGGFRNSIDLIREPLTAAVMLGLALWRDWQLTLVILGVTPLFLIIFIFSGRRVRSHQAEVQEELSLMTHNLSEGMGGQKIVKAFNLQEYIVGRFTNTQNRFFRSVMKTTMVEEMAHPLVELVGAIAFSGVVVFAYYRIQSGALSTGGFISFIAALALLMDPIRKFSQANVKLNQASAAYQRIANLLKMEEERTSGEVVSFAFHDQIELNGISFRYESSDSDVIRQLSLTIRQGEKVALVGLSGSGKSTLVNLLLGLYPLNQGEIRMDGVVLDQIPLASLREQFGLVCQDIFLFNDTVRENLTLGGSFSDQQISAALEVAYADQFVTELPDGVDTIIGDRGTRLSGGQQQRLTIARAFLQNPPILLFDEATSALDNESEKLVQQALDRLAADKTVIAVAHRLSTISSFDRIYLLNQGEVVESGDHQQLMARNGEYARLYQLTVH
ncbi:MAG: ABC transporter ATP-binding protein [Bdellovibrionales bacterium]|jgi:ATP-binding cassette, subfamily B, bacterial MsbA|nr:ABC transporter ATP-binding protein [Bdellovibrionales bacterium]MBT3526247.1 ABC transporter ATP-binding protein [Bdellovibrionales bacterium]